MTKTVRIFRLTVDATFEVEPDLLEGKPTDECEDGISGSMYDFLENELTEEGVHPSSLVVTVKELKPDAGVPEES